MDLFGCSKESSDYCLMQRHLYLSKNSMFSQDIIWYFAVPFVASLRFVLGLFTNGKEPEAWTFSWSCGPTNDQLASIIVLSLVESSSVDSCQQVCILIEGFHATNV